MSKHLKKNGSVQRFQNILPIPPLITISKSFVGPHLDNGNITQDQGYKSKFHLKLESIQCNAALELTSAISGTSKEKIYQELGLKSL